MPLSTKISGQARYIKNEEVICLMNGQARHIYKKTESGNIINVDTIKQEKEIDQYVDKIDDTNNKINPYHERVM